MRELIVLCLIAFPLFGCQSRPEAENGPDYNAVWACEVGYLSLVPASNPGEVAAPIPVTVETPVPECAGPNCPVADRPDETNVEPQPPRPQKKPAPPRRGPFRRFVRR